VEAALLDAIGDKRRPRKVIVPAEDHAAELAEVDEAIANLETDRYERGVFRGERGADRYAALMARLEARQQALSALPSRPARVDWGEGDELIGEHWKGLSAEQRGSYLREAGVRAVAWRGGDEPVPPPALMAALDGLAAAGESAAVTGRMYLHVSEGDLHALVFLGDLDRLRRRAAA